MFYAELQNDRRMDRAFKQGNSDKSYNNSSPFDDNNFVIDTYDWVQQLTVDMTLNAPYSRQEKSASR